MIGPGTFAVWVGPNESDMSVGDKVLVLMCKPMDSRIMIQVQTGRLRGHIIYAHSSDIKESKQ